MNEYQLGNENNVRFSLRDFSQKAFIPSLKGLGYQNNLNYVKVGNSHKLDYEEIAQGEMVGTVLFKDYPTYLSFVEFVEMSESLRLIYKPIDVEYFRDIDFKGVTNVRHTALVEAELSLMCKGLYYTQTDTRFAVEEIEGQSQYDLRFDYVFNDYATASIVYVNVGHVPSEMVVEIYGYIINPVIELYQNGVKKYSVSFTKTVQSGEKLIYSAKDGQNYVALDVNGVQTNIIGCMSLESNNFFRIPKGTSEIKIQSDSGIYTKIAFRILTAYKGV